RRQKLISSGEALALLWGWKTRASTVNGHVLSKGLAETIPFGIIVDVNESILVVSTPLPSGETKVWKFSLSEAKYSDPNENDPHLSSISNTAAIVISWSDGTSLTLREDPVEPTSS